MAFKGHIPEAELRRDCKADEFAKLVALGESTTAGGWSTSPERCWVSRLAAMISDFQSTPVEAFNAGIGANVISKESPNYQNSGRPAADERIVQHVIEQKPDLLVISYGLNDARGGTPLALFRDKMVQIIRRVREAIAPVIVLLGPYYMHNSRAGEEAGWGHGSLAVFEQFNQGIREVAEQEDCLFVDLLDAYKQTDWMIHYDGVHANDLGHRIVANRIFEVLAQHCSGIAKHTKELEKTSPRWRDESCLTLGFE